MFWCLLFDICYKTRFLTSFLMFSTFWPKLARNDRRKKIHKNTERKKIRPITIKFLHKLSRWCPRGDATNSAMALYVLSLGSKSYKSHSQVTNYIRIHASLYLSSTRQLRRSLVTDSRNWDITFNRKLTTLSALQLLYKNACTEAYFKVWMCFIEAKIIQNSAWTAFLYFAAS